jgi:hypothetical protein
MDQPDLLAAEILVTADVPSERERAVVEAFRNLDVAARSRVVPARRGLGEAQWLVLAALPLQAFLTGLGSKLAEDGYQGLKRLVRGVFGDQPKC